MLEELDRTSLGSESDESGNWLLRSETINEEILDLMVDAAVLFLRLPELLNSVSVLDAWQQAFDQLFGKIRGLRAIFDEDMNRKGLFEGRPGRFYLSVEEEYFLACFFQEFYELLSSSGILGVLETGESFQEPAEESKSIYNYVKDVRKNQGVQSKQKTLRRASASAEGMKRAMSRGSAVGVNFDKDNAYLSIKQFLDNCLVKSSDVAPRPQELLALAQIIDSADESTVEKFFRTFRKQEFVRVYRPIQGSEYEPPLIDALTKYYEEYLVEGHLFNAPTYETIIKETLRFRELRRASS